MQGRSASCLYNLPPKVDRNADPRDKREGQLIHPSPAVALRAAGPAHHLGSSMVELGQVVGVRAIESQECEQSIDDSAACLLWGGVAMGEMLSPTSLTVCSAGKYALGPWKCYKRHCSTPAEALKTVGPANCLHRTESWSCIGEFYHINKKCHHSFELLNFRIEEKILCWFRYPLGGTCLW